MNIHISKHLHFPFNLVNPVEILPYWYWSRNKDQFFFMFHCQAKTEKQRPASSLLLAHHTTGKDVWSFCARRPTKQAHYVLWSIV